MRSALGALVLISLGAPEAAAQSQGDLARTCIDAHVTAQRLRRDKKLREAREALVACSREGCPRMLVGECGPWLREVEQAIPTLVLSARGSDGREIADVRVSMDGAVLSERLGGTAIEVDPGEHVFRFERAGSPPLEEKVLVSEGERGRRIDVRFPMDFARQPPSPLPPTRPVPPVVFGLGAAGIVGLGVFGTMSAIGLSKKGDLDDRGCSPNCPTSDVDAVRRSFLAGDIGLAIGVGALAAAVIFYVTRPTIPGRAVARAR